MGRSEHRFLTPQFGVLDAFLMEIMLEMMIHLFATETMLHIGLSTVTFIGSMGLYHPTWLWLGQFPGLFQPRSPHPQKLGGRCSRCHSTVMRVQIM